MRPRVRKFKAIVECSGDAWDAEALLLTNPEPYLIRSPVFIRLDPPEGENPSLFVDRLLRERSDLILDPLGPCGLVRAGPAAFIFFGWYRPDAKPLPHRVRISLTDLVALEDSDDDMAMEQGSEPDCPDPESEDSEG